MARGPLNYIIIYTYSLLSLDRGWGPQSVELLHAPAKSWKQSCLLNPPPSPIFLRRPLSRRSSRMICGIKSEHVSPGTSSSPLEAPGLEHVVDSLRPVDIHSCSSQLSGMCTPVRRRRYPPPLAVITPASAPCASALVASGPGLVDLSGRPRPRCLLASV